MQQDPLFSVEDRTVLISGGSRGIGWAIAAGFAARGAKVAITGRHEETLQTAAENCSGKHPVLPEVCDISKTEQIPSLVSAVTRHYGAIDILINVAGTNRRKPALEISEEEYDEVLNTNLKGAYRLSQVVGEQMVQGQSGCQINVASLNSDRPLLNVSPYAMSKAALAQMTKALALEWGRFGIRVNAIAPGFILTDLTEKLWADATMQHWGQTNTPQQRLGTPEDLVGTALFLSSPASQFMTGQILYVDGGFTAGWAWPIESAES